MLIVNQTDLNAFCASLKGAAFITVDTEFLREKTYYPKLCLIQISDPEGRAAAIDPLVDGLDLGPVFDLLLDPQLLKVFHAGRQDLEIFYQLTGQVVRPFFDTQIAAMVCGHGDSVGYENLVRNILGKSMDKSSQFTNWSNRPLSQKQLGYALGDVIYLVDIYKKLSQYLEKRGRIEWLLQEEEILADPRTYQNPHDEAWKRIKIKTPKPKTLALLRALAAWREHRAQERNVPRTWVLRDETLADMAAQAPQTPHQLKDIRNMTEDMAFGHLGEALINVIKETLATDPKTWPKPTRKESLPPESAATVDILRMLLKIQCTKNDVATKLVADTEDLEAIALDDNADVPAMKGWRFEVFGKNALALKKGDLAIGLKNSKITKYRVSDQSEQY
jgi:ribonuclease D